MVKFVDLTEESFLHIKDKIDVEELGHFMGHIRPDPELILKWSSFEVSGKFAGSFWPSKMGSDVYLGLFLLKEFRGKNIGIFCLNYILSLAAEKKLTDYFLM